MPKARVKARIPERNSEETETCSAGSSEARDQIGGDSSEMAGSSHHTPLPLGGGGGASGREGTGSERLRRAADTDAW